MRQQREAITRSLIKHTVEQVPQTNSTQVREVTEFSFKYLDQVMRAGAYEGVCFPFFGKFIARLKQISYRDRSKAAPKHRRSKV